jgi:hypothetical protein
MVFPGVEERASFPAKTGCSLRRQNRGHISKDRMGVKIPFVRGALVVAPAPAEAIKSCATEPRVKWMHQEVTKSSGHGAASWSASGCDT